jgi:hypothetical protein
MTREALIELIRSVSNAGWGYKGIKGSELLVAALKTDDENYDDLMLCAIALAKNAADWREFHALATFWAERKKGKPHQSLTQQNNTTINMVYERALGEVRKLTDEQLAAMKQIFEQKQPLVIDN